MFTTFICCRIVVILNLIKVQSYDGYVALAVIYRGFAYLGFNVTVDDLVDAKNNQRLKYFVLWFESQ